MTVPTPQFHWLKNFYAAGHRDFKLTIEGLSQHALDAGAPPVEAAIVRVQDWVAGHRAERYAIRADGVTVALGMVSPA
ncbi:MAG TPA: hypothetical protein VIW73_08875 [Candidatus Cybelea sp.]